MRVPLPPVPDRDFPPLAIFISYSKKDADEMAGDLKRTLEAMGCEVFVAHDDILPGSSWQDDIDTALRTCEVFLPLLTQGFAESDWTDQEVGVAVATGKFIVPLKVTMNPYGFIGRLQAFTHNPENPTETALRVIELAARIVPLRDKALDSLTTSFRRAFPTVAARRLAKIIMELPGRLTPAQVEDVVLAGAFNGSIFRDPGAARFVKEVVESYHSSIEAALLRAYKNTKLWHESEGRRGVPPGHYGELMRRAIDKGERGKLLDLSLIEIENNYQPEDQFFPASVGLKSYDDVNGDHGDGARQGQPLNHRRTG